jgi:glucosamine--fructose-6-phosphate aminotransferase (isomerizing)
MIAVSTFFDELAGQPQALRHLINAYASQAGRDRLAAIPAAPPTWLLGMGASYHAALAGARHLRQGGLPALAGEATEALLGEAGQLSQANHVLYISQSGASAEVVPVLERLSPATHVTALTNAEESPLAKRAHTVLPLMAGDEQTVATKTFTNSLAALWLLGQHWTQGISPANFASLESLADCLAALVEQAPSLAKQWMEHLASAPAYAVIGAGRQAVTARHAAMIIMEWLKVPAVSATVGAFRHGPIEMVQPGLGVVVFAAPGPAYDSSCQLAQELQRYGASVLLVEHGHTRLATEPGPGDHLVEPELAPVLDIVPIQIFVEALARKRGLAPGFRYIEKVVTHI